MTARNSFAWVVLAAAAGCGGADIHSVDAPPADGGVCGDHNAPGILTLTDLHPALGATVYNHAIAHGFTVVRAPADFTNFTFELADAHTAGLPTPRAPAFRTTIVGSDIVYELTIDAWGRSPGHVEVVASGGYDLKGCSWSFPSPLFSYDIVGGPDGGEPVDGVAPKDVRPPIDGTGSTLDGGMPAIDAAVDGAGALDTAVDGGAADVPLGLDGAPPIDAAIESPAGEVRY
jgi:hypothetical protein